MLLLRPPGTHLLLQAHDEVALVAGLDAREDAEARHRAGLLRGRQPRVLAARQAAQARDARRRVVQRIDLQQQHRTSRLQR